MLIFCVQADAKLQTASLLVLTTFFLFFSHPNTSLTTSCSKPYFFGDIIITFLELIVMCTLVD